MSLILFNKPINGFSKATATKANNVVETVFKVTSLIIVPWTKNLLHHIELASPEQCEFIACNP